MKRWYQAPFPAAAGALIVGAAAMMPSLLPRGPVMVGVVAGVGAGLGYALGAAAELAWRRARGGRDPWLGSRSAWVALGALSAVGVTGMSWASRHWQADIHAVFGVAGPDLPALGWTVAVVLTGAGTAGVLVAAGRGTSRVSGAALRAAAVAMPSRRARLAAGLAGAAALGIVVITGMAGRAAYAAVSWPFARYDAGTAAGVTVPGSTLVSGSPDSDVAWEDLGRNGRAFIAGVPTTEQLQAASGKPAQSPIRAFAGLASAADGPTRAQLALSELIRFGAFDRAVLVVATSAGSGIVDQGGVSPVEYLFNGDTAIVSEQYSYLPSWLSFLLDQPAARNAGQELFDAVHQHWSTLPADDRPQLVVFGESLGAFGAEAAFADVRQLQERTDGMVLAGPPAGSALHAELTQEREPGSLQRLPVYAGGAHVRFAGAPSDLASPATPWGHPRLVYLQNATDPVVWWSPALIWSRPEWLAEPYGPGVSPALRWLPLVTFLGISGDMVNSTSVPFGFGHVYGQNQAAAWQLVLQPPKR